MNVKKTIKTIVALGAGAVLVGATILGAVATADLGNYPAPFITDGAYNAKIVVGANAAPMDVIGAIDIGASLQALAKTEVSIEGTASADVSGGVSLASGSDQVYLNEDLDANRDILTKDDLPVVLADGTFVDDNNDEYDYEQIIDVGQTPSFEFSNSGSDLDDPELLINMGTSATSTTAAFYTLKIDFDEEVDFDSDDSTGNKITIFGTEYTVGTSTTATDLQLLGGALDVTLAPGETKTITFDGETHEITLFGVNSGGDVATIGIDGSTEEITESHTNTIGGVDVYCDTVSAFNTEVNPGWVKIQLGAQELWLIDGEEVQVGSSKDEVDGTLVSFTGTPGAGLSTIQIYVAADDSDYDHLSLDDEFVDPVFGTIKAIFANVVNGPEFDDESDERVGISMNVEDDKVLSLTLTDANGNEETIPFINDDDLADEDDEPIHVVEGEAIGEDEYFILNSGNYQHFMKMTNVDLDTDKGTVEFEDVFSGTPYSIEDSTSINSTGGSDTKTIKGQTYTITRQSATSVSVTSADYGLTTGKHIVVFPYLELVSDKDHRIALLESVTINNLDAGVILELPTGSLPELTGNSTTDSLVGTVVYDITSSADDADTQDITISVSSNQTGVASGSVAETSPGYMFVEDEDNTDSDAKNAIIVYTTSASYAVTDDAVFTGGYMSETWDDSDYKGYLTDFGTYVLEDGSDSDNTQLTDISYSPNQMYAEVFFAPSDAMSTITTTGDTYDVVNPIAFGMAVLDSEISVGDDNLIVVGGPCANTVAYDLMGNPTACGEGFNPGKGLIKMFETDNKMAILVAGYEADDTKAAAYVLTHYADSDYAAVLDGKSEVEVTTANYEATEITAEDTTGDGE